MLALTAAALALPACRGTGAAPQGGATPEAAFARIRDAADRGDWRAFSRGMTERGRGDMLGEMLTGLIWSGMADPAISREGMELLRRYGLDEPQTLRRRPGESRDEALMRLSRQMRGREADFYRDWARLLRRHGVTQTNPFEGAAVRHVEGTGDAARVTIAQPDPVGQPLVLDLIFVRRESGWLYHGQPDAAAPPRRGGRAPGV